MGSAASGSATVHSGAGWVGSAASVVSLCPLRVGGSSSVAVHVLWGMAGVSTLLRVGGSVSSGVTGLHSLGWVGSVLSLHPHPTRVPNVG